MEFQKKRIRKWYFVSYRYHNVKNPYAVDYREVRKNLLQIDQLYENILYLDKYNITTYAICPCKGGCFFTCAGMCTGTCSGSCAGQSWKYGK